jgi:hypothetical protein
MFFVAILLVQWQYLEDQHEADQETILRPSNLQLQRQRCIGYYENGAESQRAECKGAERQGAEPNVRNCQIVDVIKCRTYWAALFSDNYTLRGVFRLG